MTASSKLHRGWRYYAIRIWATIFIVAGLSALKILLDEIPSDGIWLLIRALGDMLSLIAAIWTTLTIWGHDWGRSRDKAD